MLQLTELSLAFGHKTVLDKLTLQVQAGETLALLGPSGEGKSSLLAVIAGLLAPQGGRIKLNGRDISALPPEQRQLAMMFQDHALFPHLDAAANVAFGLIERGMPRQQARVHAEEMLATVGLAGRARAACHQLSGGEQQRVALARALIGKPDLLLLDEPFSSLDTHLKQQLMDDVRQRLAARPIPALLVTHDRHEAFALADRVAILQQGRILQCASPAEVLAQPASAWVARFVGFDNVYDDYAIPPAAFVLGGGQPLRHVLQVEPRVDGCRVVVSGDEGDWVLTLSARELAGKPWPQRGGMLSLGVNRHAVLRWDRAAVFG